MDEAGLRRWRDLEVSRLGATVDEDARVESVRVIDILNVVLQDD